MKYTTHLQIWDKVFGWPDITADSWEEAEELAELKYKGLFKVDGEKVAEYFIESEFMHALQKEQCETTMEYFKEYVGMVEDKAFETLCREIIDPFTSPDWKVIKDIPLKIIFNLFARIQKEIKIKK